MPNILIRDVPEEVHTELRRKSRLQHQSLQQYLAAELQNLAERRKISDILDEIESRTGGRIGLEQAVRDLDTERRGQ